MAFLAISSLCEHGAGKPVTALKAAVGHSIAGGTGTFKGMSPAGAGWVAGVGAGPQDGKRELLLAEAGSDQGPSTKTSKMLTCLHDSPWPPSSTGAGSHRCHPLQQHWENWCNPKRPGGGRRAISGIYFTGINYPTRFQGWGRQR